MTDIEKLKVLEAHLSDIAQFSSSMDSAALGRIAKAGLKSAKSFKSRMADTDEPVTVHVNSDGTLSI